MNGKRLSLVVVIGTLALVGLLLTAASAWAAPLRQRQAAPLGAGPISHTIAYQGLLLDGSGDPVDGTRSLTFRLYDVAGGGTPLATQTHSVAVLDGLFTVQLDVDSALVNGQDLWLGLQVEGDAEEMTPRQPLLPAPYAIYAFSAPWSGLTGVPAGLADGDDDTLADLSAATGQVPQWNGSAWVPATLGGAADGWLLEGNTGTTYGTHVLGTLDPVSLTLVVSGAPALRLEFTGDTAPNIVAGAAANGVAPGTVGAVIAGGGGPDDPNRVTGNGWWATVSGGNGNTASGAWATVGGGYTNTATSDYATASGGEGNTASGSWATVGGGYENSASARWATVGGGYMGVATDYYATIGGGYGNVASAYAATASGGYSNTVSSSYGTVGGGWDNEASGGGATITGGAANTASASWAAIGGGTRNTASGAWATVSGGYTNTATSDYATASGGEGNTASGAWATVGGGYTNTASGYWATIGGGAFNTASGYGGTIGGGSSNIASGAYSFAAGFGACASHSGAFVWSSGGYDTYSWGDDTFTVRSPGGARFYTASGTGTGVQLAAGGSAFLGISDRNAKENFQDVDPMRLLQTLAGLPIQTWNLKAQDPAIRHIGPVAQDFNGDFSYLFGQPEDPLYINSGDKTGIALAAAQGLYDLSQQQAAEIAELQAGNAAQAQEIEALRSENARQQAQLDDLSARVEALEVGGLQGMSFSLSSPWWLMGGLLVAGLAWRRRGGER